MNCLKIYGDRKNLYLGNFLRAINDLPQATFTAQKKVERRFDS